MVLKNKTTQLINALIREENKMVTLSIPANGHSREFSKNALTQDVLDKVNRKYLLIYEEPLNEFSSNAKKNRENPLETSRTMFGGVERTIIDMTAMKSSRRNPRR